MSEAKVRDTILRFITEITKENISYTKEFMESVELRHLDGVKGNFGVSLPNTLLYPQPISGVLVSLNQNPYHEQRYHMQYIAM
ncbi:MAG: hypothetical protein WA323_29210 [Candidatus Nitrosopolaris sp.]